jgi:hypothetical protein
VPGEPLRGRISKLCLWTNATRQDKPTGAPHRKCRISDSVFLTEKAFDKDVEGKDFSGSSLAGGRKNRETIGVVEDGLRIPPKRWTDAAKGNILVISLKG